MLLIVCKPYRPSTPGLPRGDHHREHGRSASVPSSRRIYQDPTWVTHELAGGSIAAVTKMRPTL